jgi:hypothetical protein
VAPARRTESLGRFYLGIVPPPSRENHFVTSVFVKEHWRARLRHWALEHWMTNLFFSDTLTSTILPNIGEEPRNTTNADFVTLKACRRNCSPGSGPQWCLLFPVNSDRTKEMAHG